MNDKNVIYFEKLINDLLPNWARYENELGLIREHNDQAAYREIRIKLGTLKLSSMFIIHHYKEIFSDFPVHLVDKVDSILSKCSKY